MKTLLPAILFFLSSPIFSMANEVDSLMNVAKTTENREEKLKTLNRLAWTYYEDYFLLDSMLYYSNMAMQLNSEDQYPKVYARSLFYIATAKTQMAEHVTAGEYFNKSIILAQETDDLHLEGQATAGLAWHYYSINKVEEAAERFEDLLVIAETEQDSMGMVSSLIGGSNCYMELGQFEKARLASAQATKVSRGIGVLSYMATCVSTQARTERMAGNFKQALFFHERLDSILDIGDFSRNMGGFEDEKSALYCDMGDYKQSMIHLDNSIEYSLESSDLNRYGNLIWSKQDLYARMGQWDSAYVYNVLLNELEDSVMGIEERRNLEDIEARYQNEKQEKELILAELALNDQEKITQKTESNFTRLMIITGFIGVGLLAVIILLVQRRKAAKALEDKNQIIEKNLEEKEVLLGEIHHRVKNNLQLVSTMLELQSKSDSDPKFSELVKESTNRIQTMSLIHQVLYQYDDLSGIQMDNYIRNLIDKLHQAYSSGEVKNVFDIDKIKIGIDTAIPLALVINEIYTNSLKYAFDSGGTIKISLTDKADHLELNISDDGKGFEKEKTKENFGSQLVKSFSRQLDATVEVISNLGQGTSTLIKINRFERV